MSCLASANPPASCNTNEAVDAWVGCLQASCDVECLGGSGSSSSGSTSSSASSGSTAAVGGPLTCNDVDDGAGCCDAGGVLHYCRSSGTVADQTCTGGTVCGWDDVNG